MQFKKGAFLTLKTVRPMVFKYDYSTLSLAWDVIDSLPHLFVVMSWYCYYCEVLVMPDFEPNEYLFTKHADKGKERWEIFAWATREIMSKEGGLIKCDLPNRFKNTYYKFVMGHKATIDPKELVIDEQVGSNSSPNASPAKIIE